MSALGRELEEMGWNDVIGNLRRARTATDERKAEWARGVLDGSIGLPRAEPEYANGAMSAATAFLRGDTIHFKGPASVVSAMLRACASRPMDDSPTDT